VIIGEMIRERATQGEIGKHTAGHA